jgi:hypothetical protein
MPAVRRSPSRRHVRPAPDLRYHGAAEDLIAARDYELCAVGPAGTGKSLACLHKLHAAAQNYPGMRGLIVRKTRESLTQSALVTFEDKVLGPWWRERIAANCQRRVRQSYTYPNGSELVVGGLTGSSVGPRAGSSACSKAATRTTRPIGTTRRPTGRTRAGRTSRGSTG